MSDPTWDLQRTKLNLSHEEYVRKRAQDAADIVRRAQSGTIGLLLAACKINSILHELSELQKRAKREDFLFLTGVASECDELPLDSERQYWAPQSLKEKDRKAQAYEQAIREELLTAFARIANDLKELL